MYVYTKKVMAAIRPVDNALREQIKEDLYRQILGEMNKTYEVMEKYINNLKSDVVSITDLVKRLQKDKSRGYDVGSSLDTLTFQKNTLEIDLNFFTHMKKVYISKLYEDLYKYCSDFIKSAINIEDNPSDLSDEELTRGKLSGIKEYVADAEYTLSDIFMLLSVTERNLMELASDIATFSDLIDGARAKERRGFNVGNLITNLTSQQTKLTLEFTGYCTRLEQFLRQNKNFAGKCLKRIEMISNEIVTAEELEQREQSSNANEQPEANESA